MNDRAFRSEQRRVAVRMAGALLTTVLAIGGTLAIGAPTPVADRLTIAGASVLTTVAWLVAGIANVARLRFFSPEDIAGGGRTQGSAAVRDASAVLQNTLEQVVLAVPVQISVALAIERSAALLIGLGLLFTIGRALFWHGYARGAAARALGFALTFYPTVGALLVGLVGISWRLSA